MGKKIFKILSILFILSCIGFYGYRLVHYYNIYSKNSNWEEAELTPLNKKIITNSYLNNDLTKKDDEYIYNYKYSNNYVKYSGQLWNIEKIETDGSIRLISTNNSVVLANASDFSKSSISKFMNDEDNVIYRNLESKDSYIKKTTVCLDEIEDTDNITCNKKEEYLIGIPSIEDYMLSGGIEGYMKSERDYWLSSTYEGSQYYISDEGELKKTKVTHQFEIKPIITLLSDVSYSEGDGSLENPYIVGEERIDVLNQKNIYEYVKFNDSLWKIIDQDETGTKIVLDGVLEDKKKFDKKKNVFETSSIYKYLNGEYYNSIEGKDKIVKSKWYVGYYIKENDYDYDSIYESSTEGYVGLLNMNDLSLLEYDSIFTLTPSDSKSDVIYTIASDISVYPDQVKKTKNIRPVLYLNPNIKVVSGNGSKEEPYVLE